MQQDIPAAHPIALQASNTDLLANSYLNRFHDDLAHSINKLRDDFTEGFSWNQISAHAQKFKDNINEVFGGKDTVSKANIPSAPSHIVVLQPDPAQPGVLTRSQQPEDSFDMISPHKPVNLSGGHMARSNQTPGVSQPIDQGFSAEEDHLDVARELSVN